MKTFEPANRQRRALLATSLVGGVALLPGAARAASCGVAFNRAAYERYVGLMNAEDPRFVEYFADDVKFQSTYKFGLGRIAADTALPWPRPFQRP